MLVNGQEIECIAGEIERYLQGHPHAADSLTGIGRWWLPMQRHLDAQAKVKMALDLLVKEGRIEEEVNSDGTCIYSIKDDSSSSK